MGVDYSGNFGVGVQVDFAHLFKIIAEKYKVEKETIDIIDYLDDLLQGTDFDYFEVGDRMYSGQPNEVYIVIKDVFKEGYDIREKVTNLIKFCDDNFLTIIGEVDVVGGLEIH